MLRALLPEALSRCEALETEWATLEVQNERLRHLLLKLKRMQFGRKSERLPHEQLELRLADLEMAVARADAERRAAKRRASRGALPAHLPRIEVVVAPDSAACACYGGAMVETGADTAERLGVIPARFRVVVTRRPKLACRTCPGVVVQALAAPRLIEGGLPTQATVAHVLVSRYADHLPLYRQAQILARQGVEVDRSTPAFWAGYGAAEIAPVARHLK